MKTILNKRFFFIFLALFCFLALLFAFIAEFFFKILPCQLCIYQRWLLFFMCLSSLLSFRIKFFNKVSYALIFASITLNSFQIGVEQRWVSAPESCKQKVTPLYKMKTMSFEEKQKALKQMTVVPCDVVAWRFLGISMTVWFEFAMLLIVVCRILIAMI